MQFALNNFLYAVKQIVTGGGRDSDGTIQNDCGFVLDIPLQLDDAMGANGATTLTDNTGGTVSTTLASGITDTVAKNAIASIAAQINKIVAQINGTTVETHGLALQFVAAASSTFSYNFVVPRDYDESTDSFLMRLQAAMGGTTDTPTITATVYIKRAGKALATGAVTKVLTMASGTTSAMYEFDLSLNGLKRDDALTITFAVGSHTTDVLDVYSTAVILRSCLVSYNETDGANAETGNNLR